VRRVRVDAEAISADPRSRRRRTIDPGQLALALEGTATHAYAVSFIVTNIPTYGEPAKGETTKGETVRDVEAWFRRGTDIEDRIREAKLSAALPKLPSGSAVLNTVWMWAALIAGNLSVCTSPSPGSTRVPASTQPGSVTSCCASPPDLSATAGPSPCDSHPATNRCRSC
jgi:hypothetical protein